MWSDYWQNHWGVDIWRAGKCVDTRADVIVEAVMDREGKQGKTAREKEKTLRLKFIPQNDDNQ